MRIGEKNLPGQTTQHSAVCWNLFSLRVCAFAAVVECRRCLCTSLSSRSQHSKFLKILVFGWQMAMSSSYLSCFSREPFHILKSQTCTFHNLHSSHNHHLWLWPVIVSHFSIHRVLLFSSVFKHAHIFEWINFYGCAKKERKVDPGDGDHLKNYYWHLFSLQSSRSVLSVIIALQIE